MHVPAGTCTRAFAAVVLATAISRAGAQEASVAINRVEPFKVQVTPGPAVVVGSVVTILCPWQTVSTVQKVAGAPELLALAKQNWHLYGDISVDGKKIALFVAPAKGGAKTGKPTTQWTATTIGTHHGSCSIDPANIAKVAGPKHSEFHINVTPKIASPGPATEVPQSVLPGTGDAAKREPAPDR